MKIKAIKLVLSIVSFFYSVNFGFLDELKGIKGALAIVFFGGLTVLSSYFSLKYIFQIIGDFIFNGISFRKNKPNRDAIDDGISINLEDDKNNIIQIRNPFRGVFVMGSNGSGKTESVGNPLLHQFAKNQYCGIVYDYKYPQLTNVLIGSTKELHPDNLYRIKVINCSDPYNSHKCNPIAPRYLENTSYAREFSGAIINNLIRESISKTDFWIRSSTDLLTACMWYLKEEHPQYCDLPHLFALITSDYVKVINKLKNNLVCQQMIISLISAHEQKASGQIAGVIGTLQSAVAQINTPEICYTLSSDDINLDINHKENYRTICLGNNPSLSSSLAPIYSLIINVALKQMNSKDKHKSFILLDEAPTLFIPKFDEIPNTARSNKVATVFMCQDYAQMEAMYGKVKADVLFGSLNNHFYGRTATSKTAELLSNQFGKYDKTFETTNTSSTEGKNQSAYMRVTKGHSKSTTTTKSQSIQQRPVVPPEEFLTYRSGEFSAILVDSNFGNITKMRLKYYEKLSAYDVSISDVCETETGLDIMDYYKKVRSEINLVLS